MMLAPWSIESRQATTNATIYRLVRITALPSLPEQRSRELTANRSAAESSRCLVKYLPASILPEDASAESLSRTSHLLRGNRLLFFRKAKRTGNGGNDAPTLLRQLVTSG